MEWSFIVRCLLPSLTSYIPGATFHSWENCLDPSHPLCVCVSVSLCVRAPSWGNFAPYNDSYFPYYLYWGNHELFKCDIEICVVLSLESVGLPPLTPHPQPLRV